jgi:hypothetical protein
MRHRRGPRRRGAAAALASVAAAVGLGGCAAGQVGVRTAAQRVRHEITGETMPHTLTKTKVRRLEREVYAPLPPDHFALYDRDSGGCASRVFGPNLVDPCGKYLVDAVGEYGNSWDCGVNLLAPTGYTLEVIFNTFDLQFGDSFEAWDGCTPGVNGERYVLPSSTGAYQPTPLSSEEECMYVRFKTDNQWSRGGINASIKCHTPVPGGYKGPAGPNHKTEKCFRWKAQDGLQNQRCIEFLHPGVQCVEVPPPRPSWDGGTGRVVYDNERWWPSHLFYSCDEGYHVTPKGCQLPTCENASVAVRECLPSRMFSGFRPDCSGNWCEVLQPQPGTRMRFRHRSGKPLEIAQYPCFAEYACAPGYAIDLSYHPMVTRRRTCMPDGTWSGLPPLCNPVACPANAGPPGLCDCNNGWDGVPMWDSANLMWTHTCHRDHWDNFTGPTHCSVVDLGNSSDNAASRLRCESAGSGNECGYTPYVAEVQEDCVATATPDCAQANTRIASANSAQTAFAFKLASDFCALVAGQAGKCVYKEMTGECSNGTAAFDYPVASLTECTLTGRTYHAAVGAACTNSGNAGSRAACEETGHTYTPARCTNNGDASSQTSCEMVGGTSTGNAYTQPSCSDGTVGGTLANCTRTGNTYSPHVYARCSVANGTHVVGADNSSQVACERTGRSFTAYPNGRKIASCNATLAPACDAALYATGRANCMAAGGTYVDGNSLVRGCTYTQYVPPVEESCIDTCMAVDLSGPLIESKGHCAQARGSSLNAKTGSCVYHPEVNERQSYCEAADRAACADVNLNTWHGRRDCENAGRVPGLSCKYHLINNVQYCLPGHGQHCLNATGNCSVGDAHTYDGCTRTGNVYVEAAPNRCTNGGDNSSKSACESSRNTYTPSTCTNGGNSGSRKLCECVDFYCHLPTGNNYTNSSCVGPDGVTVIQSDGTDAECTATGSTFTPATAASCTNGGSAASEAGCELTGHTFTFWDRDQCTAAGMCSFVPYVAPVNESCRGDVWIDKYTNSDCVERQDEHGFVCSTYIATGYTCAAMVNTYNYDCHCACIGPHSDGVVYPWAHSAAAAG